MATAMEVLKTEEVDAVRSLVAERGDREAARLLGLHHQTTVKCAFGLPVSRLTATIVRAKLEAMGASAA